MKTIIGLLLVLAVSVSAQTLTLVVYKHEKVMESWVDGKQVRTDKICAMSGLLGPKRQQGDFQVPEGIYRVVVFNPNSTYVLSFGINYPNIVDRMQGKRNLGGDIYFHGSCASAGCVSFTNDQIREIYPFVKSFKVVDVLIFPGADSVFAALEVGHSPIRTAAQVWGRVYDEPKMFHDPLVKHEAFWKELRTVHTVWVKTRRVPRWKPSSIGYEVLGISYTPG